MSHYVQCTSHGKQQAAFVCAHLAASLSTGVPIGFFHSGSVATRGDAWCAACEEVRLREGGETGHWNAASEAFAQITLVCGACYDRIAALNGF